MSNLVLDMSLGNPEFLYPYWDKMNATAFLDLTKDLISWLKQNDDISFVFIEQLV